MVDLPVFPYARYAIALIQSRTSGSNHTIAAVGITVVLHVRQRTRVARGIVLHTATCRASGDSNAWTPFRSALSFRSLGLAGSRQAITCSLDLSWRFARSMTPAGSPADHSSW